MMICGGMLAIYSAIAVKVLAMVMSSLAQRRVCRTA